MGTRTVVTPTLPADRPQRRVIVLGASNVTRGLRTFCETAAGLWGGPLDVMAAIGHGRSYGVPSSVFGRTLPSIRSCDLWEEWSTRNPVPTAAIITDVGNDIAYGFSPSQIAEWVQDCAQRLKARCQRVIITGLPLESLARLGPRRFFVMRTILFPSLRLTQPEALARAQELHQRLSIIAQDLRLETTFPDPNWFGIDPIHIRRRHWPTAWEQLLDPLRVELGREMPLPAGSREVWKLRRLQAKHRWFFGREQIRPQPVWFGPDGSSLSLY